MYTNGGNTKRVLATVGATIALCFAVPSATAAATDDVAPPSTTSSVPGPGAPTTTSPAMVDDEPQPTSTEPPVTEPEVATAEPVVWSQSPPPVPGLASNVSQPGDDIGPAADVRMLVEAITPDQLAPGDSFDWLLTVTNDGPAEANNLVVSSTVDERLDLTDVTSADFDCTIEASDISCTRDLLGPATSAVVIVSVVAPFPSDTPIPHTATVSADENDPDPDNNTASAEVAILAAVDPPPTDDPTTTILPDPPIPQGGLPETGSEVTLQVAVGSILVVLGGALVTASVRRRPPVVWTGPGDR